MPQMKEKLQVSKVLDRRLSKQETQSYGEPGPVLLLTKVLVAYEKGSNWAACATQLALQKHVPRLVR